MNRKTGVFHEGEQWVQARAGVSDMARRVGNGIHDAIPPVAQTFLAQQPFAVVGMTDAEGRVWASILAGERGFLRAENSRRMRVDALPSTSDPLYAVLTQESAGASDIGLLAIELAARRRMRVNGLVIARNAQGFAVAVQQAYANCPKYIQARDLDEAKSGDEPLTTGQAQHSEVLTGAQQAWIGEADTFFIASRHPEAGADVSHRGGNPGFVNVLDARTLLFPDYSGNAMFNTLGNLAANPASGLLFVDFETGATLQITGEAEILWADEVGEQQTSAYGANLSTTASGTGRERAVLFRIAGAIEINGALSLRGQLRDYSPFNPAVPPAQPSAGRCWRCETGH